MYPDKNTEAALTANFFFFLVAIDHRTHPDGQQYTGIVNGTQLTGAELLWSLAKRRFDEDPDFFSPLKLSNVSVKEIIELFKVNQPQQIDVAGPESRTLLLRDCAQVLQTKFEGSILNVVAASEGLLVRDDSLGFLQQLKQFKAYEDPINKKSFLLSKFLERRHFVTFKDPTNLHVPVDNILLRLALRTGIVKVTDSNLDQKIRTDVTVSPDEEYALRLFTRYAFDRVGALLKMNATYLDDILWEFGRAQCQVPKPFCDTLPNDPFRRAYRMIRAGPIGECPFSQGCAAYKRPEMWTLKEPNVKTIYY